MEHVRLSQDDILQVTTLKSHSVDTAWFDYLMSGVVVVHGGRPAAIQIPRGVCNTFVRMTKLEATTG